MKKLKQAEEKQNNAEREAQKNLVQEAYREATPEMKFYTQLLRVITIPHSKTVLSKGYYTILRPPQLG